VAERTGAALGNRLRRRLHEIDGYRSSPTSSRKQQ
jgi:hypothetical protein